MPPRIPGCFRGAGDPWTVSDVQETGRPFRVPAAIVAIADDRLPQRPLQRVVALVGQAGAAGGLRQSPLLGLPAGGAGNSGGGEEPGDSWNGAARRPHRHCHRTRPSGRSSRAQPRRSRANLRPPSRSASVIDRLLKNQNPLENRYNLRPSSPHLVVGKRPGTAPQFCGPKFMDTGAIAVPIPNVRFRHSTIRRRGLRPGA